LPSSNVLVRAPAPDPDADPDTSTAPRPVHHNDFVKLLFTHNDYNHIRLTCTGTKVFTLRQIITNLARCVVTSLPRPCSVSCGGGRIIDLRF
jgi:hypothetical protein